MGFELLNPVYNEQVMSNDQLFLVIKDPWGIAEVMRDDQSFPLCVHKDANIKNIYDAFLEFNPAAKSSERFLGGVITYDPGLFPRPTNERFARLYSDLTDGETIFTKNQVTLFKDHDTGKQGLIISLGETGQNIRIYDEPPVIQTPSAAIRIYADFAGRYDLDIDLAANTIAAWLLAQISIGRAGDSLKNGPHHIFLESLAYDKVAEFENITQYYQRFQRVDPSHTPELQVSDTELALLAECGLSPERYDAILQALKERWSKSCDAGEKLGTIKVSDIAELMNELAY
jgi:hypothetical protein